MADTNKPDIRGLLESIYKNLKLLMKDPRRGIKAGLILVYVVFSVCLSPFAHTKLDWESYNPFCCFFAVFICAIIFFAVGYFLLRIFIKSDTVMG